MLKKLMGAGAVGLLAMGTSVLAAGAATPTVTSGCAIPNQAGTNSCTFTPDSSYIGYGGITDTGWSITRPGNGVTEPATVVVASGGAGTFADKLNPPSEPIVPGTTYTFTILGTGGGAAGSPTTVQ